MAAGLQVYVIISRTVSYPPQRLGIWLFQYPQGFYRPVPTAHCVVGFALGTKLGAQRNKPAKTLASGMTS